MSLERLGKEIQHELSPFITAESTLHGVEVPNIEFIDEIVSSFTEVPFAGLYNWNTNTIILNYNQLRRLLDIGTTEEEAKLNVIETGFHEFKHHIDATKFNMTPKVYSGNKHKWERRACRYAAGMMGKYNLRAGWDESFGEGKFRVLKAQWNHGNPDGGSVFEGWHSSPTGEIGISDPEKSTEGVGYYIALEKETALFFGRVVEPVSITLFNPLDARGEPAYILNEADEIMEPPIPRDSEWLSAIKEAVSRSGTTNENWGWNQARLNQAVTDVLQERGYDGILIEDWAVKFASSEERSGLEGYLKSENPAHIHPDIEAKALNQPFMYVESADVKETFIYADHPVAIVDIFEFGGMWNPVNKLIMFDTKTWRSLNEEEKLFLLDHEIVERELAMENYAQYRSHSDAVGANHSKANEIVSKRYGADVMKDLIARGLLAK